jgi:amino acid transporter
MQRPGAFLRSMDSIYRKGQPMSDANATNSHESTELLRAIDWKQGLIIAMGIPILIVPSLCDLSMDLWGMSIIIWVLSVLSGFLINLPLGEMCATFGVAGVGGSIQHVFKDDEKYRDKRINGGRMLGSFGAWCYFATWVPVIPIFTIATGVYINDYFKLGLEGFTATLFYLALGVLIYGFIIITGRKGLEGGARTQLVLSIITIIPILVICLVPLATGAFHLSYITDQITPPDWKWDGNGILMVLGCLVVAQWSAVGWESVATYGAEYKNPSSDVPKALMACGMLCLFMYFIIAFCVYGTLGMVNDGSIQTVAEAGASTLIPIAVSDFGPVGGVIAVFLLIAGMVMIIQSAFLSAARTIQVMASEGNLPLMFATTNSYGVPMKAMFFEVAIGFGVILAGITAYQVLAISALGFVIALGLSCVAFVKSRHDPRFKDIPRIYRVGKFSYAGAWFMIIFEFLFMVPGILYYVYQYPGLGLPFVFIGIGVNLLYVPVWLIIQRWNHTRHPDIPCGINFSS